jgi:hypothetical protein
VKPTLERDHGRPLRPRPRELDRVLDRLGACVEERGLRRPSHRGDPGQPFGQLHVRLVRDDRVVGVREALELLLRRRDDARVRVSDVEAPDAAREIDERVAVDVGERRAPALGGDDRDMDRERGGDEPRVPGENLLRAGARDGRPELDRARDSHCPDLSGQG